MVLYRFLDSTHPKRSQESLNNDIERFRQTGCHRIDIQVKENRIIVKSQNIKSVLLFLDDKLIDITKPVDVMVNDKLEFSGFVNTSIDSLFKCIDREIGKHGIFTRCIELNQL